MTFDAVVVGAGIIGAATARALSAVGMEVVVVDSGQPASGTSAACEGNLLVSDKGPGEELALAQYAARLWREVVPELTEQLGDQFPSIEYEQKGGLVVATTEAGAAALTGFAASQRAAGVEARQVDPTDYEPDLTSETTAAVFYPEDAQLQPTIATEALLASARANGAIVIGDSPVTAAERDEHGAVVGVHSGGRVIRGSHVILAAGPHSGQVSARLGAPLPVLPRRGELLVTARMRQRVFHKVYDADYVGAVGADDAGLHTSSVVESTRGGTMLIGSSRQQVGFDSRVRVNVMEQVAAKAVRLFPFLAAVATIRSYGGFRPFMPDHLPVIGADHRMPGLWHATGHEGAGIGLSLATAELLRDLILGAPTQVPAAPFGVDRASLAPYLAQAGEVASESGAGRSGR